MRRPRSTAGSAMRRAARTVPTLGTCGIGPPRSRDIGTANGATSFRRPDASVKFYSQSAEPEARRGPGRGSGRGPGPGPAGESGVETGLAIYQTILPILGAAVVLKADIVVLYVCARVFLQQTLYYMTQGNCATSTRLGFERKLHCVARLRCERNLGFTARVTTLACATDD
jgi:hypothetical protein